VSSTKPFRVGFIGAGGIAHTHANNFKKIDGVEIVAAADVAEKGLTKFKDAFSVTKTFSDYKEMLAKCPEIDAVSVCTPNGLHAENSNAALKAGKHVLVEKPMAMSAKEGQSMIDAAKKNGKELIVGFQYRFEPRSQFIRKQVDAGVFGKIMYARAQALRRRGIPNWGVFGRKDLQGGGPMIDIGVHILEVTHYMMGAPRPVAAFGNTWTFHGNKPSDVVSVWPNWDHKTYTVEDFAVGMIRFENSAMLNIEASFVAHIEKDVWNTNLFGEKAGANWEANSIFRDDGGYMMNTTAPYVGNWDHFAEKIKHFVGVCRGERKNDCPAEHGLMIQKMLDGVYASAAAGKEVPIE
jgi:predicted dehydrogenase